MDLGCPNKFFETLEIFGYGGTSATQEAREVTMTMTFVAFEFDLAAGKQTGRFMEFDALDLQEASRKLVYTLNLSSAGWQASPSGKTVGRRSGDIGWHLGVRG